MRREWKRQGTALVLSLLLAWPFGAAERRVRAEMLSSDTVSETGTAITEETKAEGTSTAVTGAETTQSSASSSASETTVLATTSETSSGHASETTESSESALARAAREADLGPGWYDGTKEQTNPFPEVLPDALVQENSGKKLIVVRYRVTRPGGEVIICGGEDLPSFNQKGTKVEFCAALLPASGLTNLKYTLNDGKSFFVRPLRAKGNVPAAGLQRTGWERRPWEDVTLNGQAVECFPNEPEFGFRRITKPQYLHLAFTVNEALLGFSSYWGLSHSEGGGSAANAYQFCRQSYGAAAHFHFVDEWAYRRARGLKIGDVPNARSAGTAAYSSAAFGTYDVKDLAPEKTSVARFSLDTDASSDSKFPVLRPAGEAPAASGSSSTDGVYYQFADVPGHFDLSISTELKPSLADLKKTEIPGYIYAGHDIDLPEGHEDFLADDATLKSDGNHYLSMSLTTDGSPAIDKHYYVLERPLPVPVVIKKEAKDEADKALPGAVFTLQVTDTDGSKHPVPGTFVSDEKGEIHLSSTPVTREELKAAAEAGKNEIGYVRRAQDLFLYPGLTYELTETKAPEGYQISEPKTFVLTPVSAEGEGPVQEQIIRVQNEKIPPVSSSTTGETSATSTTSTTGETSVTSTTSTTGETSVTSTTSTTGETSATSTTSTTGETSATSTTSTTGETSTIGTTSSSRTTSVTATTSVGKAKLPKTGEEDRGYLPVLLMLVLLCIPLRLRIREER